MVWGAGFFLFWAISASICLSHIFCPLVLFAHLNLNFSFHSSHPMSAYPPMCVFITRAVVLTTSLHRDGNSCFYFIAEEHRLGSPLVAFIFLTSDLWGMKWKKRKEKSFNQIWDNTETVKTCFTHKAWMFNILHYFHFFKKMTFPYRCAFYM